MAPTDPDPYPWAPAFLEALPYARESGLVLEEASPGRARLRLPARATWAGDVLRGRVHTGCLCVLADTACGMAVAFALEALEPFATLDLRMDYLSSAAVGADLVCEAHCHRLTRSVAFVRGEVRQPGQPEPVATVTSAFILTGRNHRPEGGRARRAAAPAPAPAFQQVPGEALAAAAVATQPAIPPGRSPYVDHLGVVLHLGDPAGPIFRLPYRPELIGNPMVPALHGGVLAGFAETAMILHLAAADPEGGIPKAVDFTMDYLRAAAPVDTFAQGLTIRQGNRVSLVHASLWQDSPLRPVATARGQILMP